jgi:pimeloyl-ACP methyl ester carboxylesterase
VHGAPNAGSTFAPLVAGLRPHRLLVLDRPGCGLSGPIDPSTHAPQAIAVQTLTTTLDQLGLDRVDVVGSSFGGAWSLWFALAHPERVRRLVLLGAPAFVPKMLVPGFMKLLLTPLVGSLIANLPPSVGGTKWTFKQMGHSQRVLETVIPAEFWRWSVRLMADTPTMANDVRVIRGLATRRGVRPEIEFSSDQLRSMYVPTLVYWGDADTFGGADVAHAIADLLPNAKLEIAPGAGHLPWLDDPARAARSLATFLASEDEFPAPQKSMTRGAAENVSEREPLPPL